MAVDFDNFPTYDPLVAPDGIRMSAVWVTAMATFVQTLTDYLSQNGMFVPPVTTAQRNTLLTPVPGQLIYNTTLQKFQGYENGAWVNLV